MTYLSQLSYELVAFGRFGLGWNFIMWMSGWDARSECIMIPPLLCIPGGPSDDFVLELDALARAGSCGRGEAW
jgi:hypothetical protein